MDKTLKGATDLEYMLAASDAKAQYNHSKFPSQLPETKISLRAGLVHAAVFICEISGTSA